MKSAASAPVSFKARRALAYLRQEAVGIAQDFWKDGGGGKAPSRSFGSSFGTPSSFGGFGFDRKQPAPQSSAWHAAPGELSERMWGDGFVAPCDEYITDLLIKPLNLTKEMSVLDLSAGLGSRQRLIASEFNVKTRGREPDPEVAVRGMDISESAGYKDRAPIYAYDPMSLTEADKYDCVLARETIYRAADKEKFISSIIACCKPKAQISFTDYILNPESRDAPQIAAWKKFERGAEPIGLVEMAELWAKAGIGLRVHDDQTDAYKKEIKQGLMRFAKFMASGVKPDAATKRAIEKRIMTWAHRMAAFEHGLLFYRFYGMR